MRYLNLPLKKPLYRAFLFFFSFWRFNPPIQAGGRSLSLGLAGFLRRRCRRLSSLLPGWTAVTVIAPVSASVSTPVLPPAGIAVCGLMFGVRADHYMASQVFPFRPGNGAVDLLYSGVDNPAFIGIHRFQRAFPSRFGRF